MALLLPIMTGCDTQSANARITVNPSAANVSKDESIEFVASGGFDYVWSLDNLDRGSLSTRTGDRTVYTSHYSPGTNSWTQILTVTSFIAGDTEGRTNATAEVYIRHL